MYLSLMQTSRSNSPNRRIGSPLSLRRRTTCEKKLELSAYTKDLSESKWSTNKVHHLTSDLGIEKIAASISGGATMDVGLRRCFPDPSPAAPDDPGGGEDPSRLSSDFKSSSTPLLILSSSLLLMYFLP